MELVEAVEPGAVAVAGAPQRLRNVRPRAEEAVEEPQKRRCKAPSDANETAIAEMLLGLSGSPRSSSPRDSDISTEDEEFLPLSPTRRRGGGKGASPRRAGSQQLARAKSSSMADEECDLASQSSGGSPTAAKAAKKLPGRCKCGKRVSASHPPCKSELMLLCERFCARFGRAARGDGQPSRIHLNECAVALGVPRRRLYDITIVFEAVEVVKRTGKLAYVWRGMAGLPDLIQQLQREEADGCPVADRKGNAPPPGAADKAQQTHSLWALSRKFVRLMLTTKGPIQLSEAAEHLIGEATAGTKRQQTQITVERRLYDIGSILATLNLIHRTYIEGKRQPAFSWNWDWSTAKPAVPAAAPPPPGRDAPLPPPLACALPQPAAVPLPVGALSLSMPLGWSLPQPAMFPALAQHELLSLPPLPPALAASLLQMPPTLSGSCQMDGQMDWALQQQMLAPLAPLAPVATLAPALQATKPDAPGLLPHALQ